MKTILTLALLCTLAACGGGGSSDPNYVEEPKASTQPVCINRPDLNLPAGCK